MHVSFRSRLMLALIAITFFAYLSSLGNPFIWDDEQFITQNSYVQTFDMAKIFTTNTIAGAGEVSSYYRPLTTLSFAIDTRIWGQNPTGFHFTNLFLHTASGILLFFLLLGIGIGDYPAFFISLFFLIHPVQVEAVTYINSRGDSLYSAFLFGSLLFFNTFIRQQTKKIFAIGSLLLFVFSIFSKETAIAAFPLFFVLVILYMFKNKENFSQSMQTYAKPLFVAVGTVCSVALYAVLRLTVLHFADVLDYYSSPTFYSTHFWVRLFTFAKVLWIYLGILVFPYPLHMERSVTLVTSVFDWHVWGVVVLMLALVVLAIYEMKKNHTAVIFFGCMLSACLLIPVSGIVPINGILYEHWLYVPMVGFFVICYGLFALFLAKSVVITKMLTAFVIVLSILYIFLTIRQNNIWGNPITFYVYTLQFAPTSARLHNNLGMSLADSGDNKQAIIQYQKALALDDKYPQIYNNLGNAQIAAGDYKAAEKNLQKALQLSSDFSIAKVNLIKLYLVTRQFNKAKTLATGDKELLLQIQEYQKATQ